MIYDNIKNIKRYSDDLPLFKKAVEKLDELCCAEPARIKLDGDKLIAVVQKVSTDYAENCENENHGKYIDVHYIIEGSEQIDFWKRQDCEPTMEFDVPNDYELCTKPEHISSVVLNEGDFAVIYPGEVHASKVCIGEPKNIRKIVFKIEY